MNFPIIKCNDFEHRIANSVILIGVKYKINSDKIEIEEEFLK